MKSPLFFLTLAVLPLLAMADGEIARKVTSSGVGQVPYRRRCSGDFRDNAVTLGVVEAIQNALIACGSNVRQLTPFVEKNDCEDFSGGPITQTAEFGCLKRPEESRNMILSSSYFAPLSQAHEILDQGFNTQGEESFFSEAERSCGGKFVQVRPFLMAAKINNGQLPATQMEVITTSQVYCGMEPELLKD